MVCHGNNSFRRMDVGACEKISFHRKWINANEVFFITCAPRLLFIMCSGFLCHRMTKILHLLKSTNANNEKRRKYLLFHLKYKSLRTIVFIYINTLLLMLQLNLRERRCWNQRVWWRGKDLTATSGMMHDDICMMYIWRGHSPPSLTAELCSISWSEIRLRMARANNSLIPRAAGLHSYL